MKYRSTRVQTGFVRDAMFTMGILTCLILTGCTHEAKNPPDVVLVSETVSTEPGELELFEPKVTFTEPDRIQFEVRYRFIKGKPDKYYMCEVLFPGTTNLASKPMEKWELKSEGIIRDGIRLPNPPVTTFQIQVSESSSPQDGYRKISNLVTGDVK